MSESTEKSVPHPYTVGIRSGLRFLCMKFNLYTYTHTTLNKSNFNFKLVCVKDSSEKLWQLSWGSCAQNKRE